MLRTAGVVAGVVVVARPLAWLVLAVAALERTMEEAVVAQGEPRLLQATVEPAAMA